MSHTSLTLQLVLSSGPAGPAGTVVLDNTSGADVRVWRAGNQWGDTALSFEVWRRDDIRRLVRRPQVYTVNLPLSAVVPAGATHEWPFDLSDGQWEADAPLDQLLVPGAQLVAVYDVPLSSEAMDHDVWTGQLRSDPVLLDESRPSLPGPDVPRRVL